MCPTRSFGKASRRLIPFLVLCYAVNFLDRVNVGFAALAMNEDIGLTPSIFGLGAGSELPAFARRVVAMEDAFFQLPEVAMGLVPGAGGTVSIPRRIGRQRTAYLALSGLRLDAATARRWGLVDEIRA